MLLALRSSRPHCSLRPLHTRFLTTYPDPIPTYETVWDPTKYSILPPPTPTTKSEVDQREDDARRDERRQLRDTQRVGIIHQFTQFNKLHAIRRLNLCLWLATQRGKNGQRPFLLWRSYVRAKGCIPELLSMLPHSAWDVLWDVQVKHNPQERSRQSNLEELYRDMNSAGMTATVGLRIEYLESLFLSGNEEEALKAWEDDHRGTDSSSRHDYKPEHLELGARLHALAGHPDRAREIMEQLFDLYPKWDMSVMLSVFRAHTGVKSAPHHDTAKTIYINLKERMGNTMTLEHYDTCFVGFLQARHLRYSRQVFGDMVKDGRLATSFFPKEIEVVLKRLHMLYRLGTDIEKMTSIALQVLKILPQAYHSHIFDSWMRSAVIMKAPDVATQILDMMFNRGYRPETIHFNLLLKALFRTKDEPRVLKAENIGWRMIEETRKASSEKSSAEPAPEMIAKKAALIAETVLDSDAARKVPKANMTTFSLIMQHHATNLQWEHVDYLTRQLKETDLQPNADFMNVVMDNYCRKGKYADAWKTYKSLTDVPEGAPEVFPDGSSIRCLWKVLRLALGDHATQDDCNLPTPRQLLAETVLWWARCSSRRDIERFRTGLAAANHKAITSLMLHCFSYVQDFAGSLVALHVMRSHLSIFPTDDTAEILQKQAAWVDMQRETKSVRSQYFHSQNNKINLEKLGRVYYVLMEKRLERAGLTEDDFDHMSDEELGDLGLNLLSEFVRVVLKRSYPPEAVEAMIDDAKKEVGVPDMSTGDLDAFAVA